MALAGATHATDVTYPQLNNQSTVLDTDLLAIWRSPGPLAHLNASLFSQYVINGLGKSTFLQISNNLSDVPNPATARANLLLGTAAQASTGTSGTALCQLNANCIWTGTDTFSAAPVISTGTAAASTDYLIMRPTDLAAGKPELFFHKNTSALIWELDSFDGTSNQTATLNVNLAAVAFAGTASAASFTGPLTGNASTASKWQTARTETLSGDVTGSASVDGSGNWTVSTTIQPGAVTGAKIAGATIAGSNIASATIAGSNIASNTVANSNLANMAANTIKGNATGSAAAPQDLTPGQVLGAMGFSGSLNGSNPSAVTIPTPQGNAILNWGQAVSIGAGGNFAFTFVTPYPNNVEVIAGGNGSYCTALSITNTGFTIHNNGGGVQNCYWIAIGN